MPTTKYETKRWVYVPVTAGSITLNYAFLTNIKDAESTDLGQINLTGSTANVVIGCSYPKPSRATIRESNKVVSSFIANSAVGAAKTKGYAIQRSNKRSPLGKKSLTSPYKVTVAGIDYGWQMANTTKSKLSSQIGSLGIQELITTNDIIKCVVGANYPQPARINLTIAASGAEGVSNTISTFCDADIDIGNISGVMGASLKGANDNLSLFTGLG